MLNFKKLVLIANRKCFFEKLFSIFLVLTALLLSSCLRTAREPVDQQGEIRDFRVRTITGDILEDNTDNIWTIPTQKKYNLRACLIGRATNQQLPQGQEFMIIGANGEAQKDNTDDQGCINWNEYVDFNFTSNSIYLKKTRRLRSLGSYKGEAEVAVAINPWMSYRNEPGEEVIDIERSGIADGVMVEEADEELLRQGIINRDKTSSELLIDPNLNLTISYERDIKDGQNLKLVLRVKPYIQPKNMRGAKVPFYFDSGKYRIFAQLVSNNIGLKTNDRGQMASQHSLLTKDFISAERDATADGSLDVVVYFNLKREIREGEVHLALKIEPLGTPYPITPYEALHRLDKFDKVKGDHKAPQILGNMSPEPFSFGSFLKNETDFNELKKLKFEGQEVNIANDLPPVYYGPFEPKFIRIKSGETATERTLMYRVTTVVKDAITGEPRPREVFRIKKLFNKTEEIQTSDEFGRLIWNDELHHLYYQPEQYFFPQFEITKISGGNVFKNRIAVNPWDFGWTFGEDVRGQESYYAKIAKQHISPPDFLIDAFRYQTVRFRYVIDEFLTLNVKKAVVMALDPLVEKKTITEGRKFEPLRNGIYLVKVALVKYYLDPFQNNTRLIKVGSTEINSAEDKSCEGFDKDFGHAERVQTDTVEISKDYPEESSGDLTNAQGDSYRLETVRCNGKARQGQYTTVIKKLLRVQAGRITTPLEFSMRDLRMMSIRSNIMIQLETIDETKLLADNLANQTINRAIREYYEVNNPDVSAEKREALVDEKIALYNFETEKLKETMASNLEEIQKEREEVNKAYERRDEVLSDLQKSLGSAVLAENSQTYKDNVDLPEEEFLARMNVARNSINQIHSQVESYWSDYERSWIDNQLEGYGNDSNRGILLSTPVEQLSKKPSYYDYLASMQTFLKDFGVGLGPVQQDLDNLAKNEYSNTPLTPLVDLDSYVEKNSGLRKRTFIGPCTLVENDNMSELRPTDKIDEAYSEYIDNSQLVYTPLTPPADNRVFERSAYHDSLVPFADTHVDDFIDIHIHNEEQYIKEMKVLSQMGRYVRAYNLEYVSLKDKPLREFESGCDLDSLDPKLNCFKPVVENVSSKNDFLHELNKHDEAQLLGRYFYVNPLSESKKLNEVISRENKLEPLWDRALREYHGLMPNKSDRWKNQGLPYATRGWGNHYHRSAKNYLTENYSDRPIKSSTKTIKKWLDTGPHNLTLLDSVKICSALSSQIDSLLEKDKLVDNTPSFWSSKRKTSAEYLLEYCFSKIHLIDGESIESGLVELNDQVISDDSSNDRVFMNGVSFDRRRRIVRTGRYEHQAGKNTNLNVGIDFGLATYQDVNSVASLGLNGGALLGIGGVGAGAWAGLAAAGVVTAGVAPILGVAAAGAAAVVGGVAVFQGSASKASGVNMTTGTSVSMATFLVVQKAEEDIVLTEYEKCLSFQFSPEAINEMNFEMLRLSEGVADKDPKLRNALSRGYFICEGNTDNPPVKVRENYYYITQHFTAGDMLDSANLLNHVWLLALRGERDFNAFIKTVIGKEIDKDGQVIEEDRLYDYSLSRLSQVYGKVIPSFPGMYSVQDPIPIHTGSPKTRGF